MLIGSRWNPKGPSLNQLDEYVLSLSGIRVRLLCPESNNLVHRGGVGKLSLNIYDKSIYEEDKDESECPLELGLIGKNWVFRGLPVVDGKLGDLSMNISLSYLPLYKSLFRPRRLECAIERYIYMANVYATSGYCRVNYAKESVKGTDWARYTCYGEPDEKTCCYQALWQTPISDEHLLTLRFTQTLEVDNKALRAAYDKLIMTIMNSVHIELPSDIQQQKAAVKAAYPYESFPEYLPPYEFERYEPTARLDVIRQVSADFNHDSSIPDEIFDQKVEEIIAAQDKKAENTHQKVIDEHLRFEALEAEDYQQYLLTR